MADSDSNQEDDIGSKRSSVKSKGSKRSRGEKQSIKSSDSKRIRTRSSGSRIKGSLASSRVAPSESGKSLSLNISISTSESISKGKKSSGGTGGGGLRGSSAGKVYSHRDGKAGSRGSRRKVLHPTDEEAENQAGFGFYRQDDGTGGGGGGLRGSSASKGYSHRDGKGGSRREVLHPKDEAESHLGFGFYRQDDGTGGGGGGLRGSSASKGYSHRDGKGGSRGSRREVLHPKDEAESHLGFGFYRQAGKTGGGGQGESSAEEVYSHRGGKAGVRREVLNPKDEEAENQFGFYRRVKGHDNEYQLPILNKYFKRTFPWPPKCYTFMSSGYYDDWADDEGEVRDEELKIFNLADDVTEADIKEEFQEAHKVIVNPDDTAVAVFPTPAAAERAFKKTTMVKLRIRCVEWVKPEELYILDVPENFDEMDFRTDFPDAEEISLETLSLSDEEELSEDERMGGKDGKNAKQRRRSSEESREKRDDKDERREKGEGKKEKVEDKKDKGEEKKEKGEEKREKEGGKGEKGEEKKEKGEEKKEKTEEKKDKGEGKKEEGEEKKDKGEGKKEEGEEKKDKGEGKKEKGEEKKDKGEEKKEKAEDKKDKGEEKKEKGEEKKDKGEEKKEKGEEKKDKGEEKKEKGEEKKDKGEEKKEKGEEKKEKEEDKKEKGEEKKEKGEERRDKRNERREKRKERREKRKEKEKERKEKEKEKKEKEKQRKEERREKRKEHSRERREKRGKHSKERKEKEGEEKKGCLSFLNKHKERKKRREIRIRKVSRQIVRIRFRNRDLRKIAYLESTLQKVGKHQLRFSNETNHLKVSNLTPDVNEEVLRKKFSSAKKIEMDKPNGIARIHYPPEDPLDSTKAYDNSDLLKLGKPKLGWMRPNEFYIEGVPTDITESALANEIPSSKEIKFQFGDNGIRIATVSFSNEEQQKQAYATSRFEKIKTSAQRLRWVNSLVLPDDGYDPNARITVERIREGTNEKQLQTFFPSAKLKKILIDNKTNTATIGFKRINDADKAYDKSGLIQLRGSYKLRWISPNEICVLNVDLQAQVDPKSLKSLNFPKCSKIEFIETDTDSVKKTALVTYEKESERKSDFDNNKMKKVGPQTLLYSYTGKKDEKGKESTTEETADVYNVLDYSSRQLAANLFKLPSTRKSQAEQGAFAPAIQVRGIPLSKVEKHLKDMYPDAKNIELDIDSSSHWGGKAKVATVEYNDPRKAAIAYAYTQKEIMDGHHLEVHPIKIKLKT